MHIVLITVNLLVSFVSAGASVLALIRPAYLSGSSHIERGEIIYARMYAARAIPLGLAVGLLPFLTAGTAVMWLLFTCAAIQLLDVFIAIGKKDKVMAMGASIATIIHLSCGVFTG